MVVVVVAGVVLLLGPDVASDVRKYSRAEWLSQIPCKIVNVNCCFGSDHDSNIDLKKA